jgi:hypothetical protein
MNFLALLEIFQTNLNMLIGLATLKYSDRILDFNAVVPRSME